MNNPTLPSIEALAAAYVVGSDCAPTANEIHTLNSWIDKEFSALPCKVNFWTGDISLAECRNAFSHTGILNISTANSEHPYLTKAANARFRAIHDWAHICLGADDSFAGEFSTWWNNTAPKSIQWILFSEIVLQAAAAIHYGDFQQQKFIKYGNF